MVGFSISVILVSQGRCPPLDVSTPVEHDGAHVVRLGVASLAHASVELAATTAEAERASMSATVPALVADTWGAQAVEFSGAKVTRTSMSDAAVADTSIRRRPSKVPGRWSHRD